MRRRQRRQRQMGGLVLAALWAGGASIDTNTNLRIQGERALPDGIVVH